MVVILLIRGVKWVVKKSCQKLGEHKDAKLQEEEERDVQEFERARPEPFIIERVSAVNSGDVLLDLNENSTGTISSVGTASTIATTSSSGTASTVATTSSSGSVSSVRTPAVTEPPFARAPGGPANTVPADAEPVDAETLALARRILRERSRQRNPKQTEADVAADAERELEAISDELPPPAYEEAVAMPAIGSQFIRSASAGRRPLPQPGSLSRPHAASMRY